MPNSKVKVWQLKLIKSDNNKRFFCTVECIRAIFLGYLWRVKTIVWFKVTSCCNNATLFDKVLWVKDVQLKWLICGLNGHKHPVLVTPSMIRIFCSTAFQNYDKLGLTETDLKVWNNLYLLRISPQNILVFSFKLFATLW